MGYYVKKKLPSEYRVKDGQIWVKGYPSNDSSEKALQDTIEIIDVRNGITLYFTNGCIESDSTYIIPINFHLIKE